MRSSRGVTQKAAAAAASISPQYLADIEAGRRGGNETIAQALAKALAVPAAALLTLTGEAVA